MAARRNPRATTAARTRRRLNPRRLLQCGLLVIALLGGVSIWHHFAPPATQERIESVTLDIIDLARENRATPKEIVFWLDLLADKIPLARGKTVAAGITIEAGAMTLGGTPAAARDYGLLKNTGYLAAYDENHRNPAWVAYRVFQPKYDTGDRPEKFEPDNRTRAKVTPAAYTNSGYDRGHMAPNRAIAACYGREAQHETFLMSNVVPQLHGLNAALWESLEARVIERHTRRFGDVWILCGPVYDPGKPPRKIAGAVAIPDAFFLIIATREPNPDATPTSNTTDLIRAQAYLIPHREIPAKADPAKYLVSIREIERLTALNFFPLLSAETQDALETTPAKRAW